jgi:hypothetical protein
MFYLGANYNSNAQTLIDQGYMRLTGDGTITLIEIDPDGAPPFFDPSGNPTPFYPIVFLQGYSYTAADLGTRFITPVVLDLNQDKAFDLTNVAQSSMHLDVNHDQAMDHLSWVGPSDGVLVYDAHDDGFHGGITDTAQFAFSQYLEHAHTDLEGLAFFDTNKDFALNAQDVEFSKFAVWQDANQNGKTDSGELLTLNQSNITSINLTTDNQTMMQGDAIIYGQGTVTLGSGGTMALADAGFKYVSTAADGAETEGHLPSNEGVSLGIVPEAYSMESQLSVTPSASDSLNEFVPYDVNHNS